MEQKPIIASDLRLGNLVTSKTWGGHHVLTGVQFLDDVYAVIINDFNHVIKEGLYCELSPIPITPEWLERGGFNQYVTPNGQMCFNLGEYRVYLNGEPSFHLMVSDGYYPTLCKIKYVHQLQNLYFALTGKELEFGV